MAVKARFFVAELTLYTNDLGGYADPPPMAKVVMRPVSRGEANKEWASATPSGEFQMTVRGSAVPFFYERLKKEVSITIEDIPAEGDTPGI